jgi:hypothetical protein
LPSQCPHHEPQLPKVITRPPPSVFALLEVPEIFVQAKRRILRGVLPAPSQETSHEIGAAWHGADSEEFLPSMRGSESAGYESYSWRLVETQA